MFHVKHRWDSWRSRLLGWFFGLITPDPGIRLPKVVIPPDDDEQCST